MTPVSFARKAEIKLGRQTEVFSRAFVARRGKIAETRDQVSIQGCVGLNASGGLAGSRNHRGEDGEPSSEKKGEGDKRGREWEGEVRETHESDHPRPWNVSRHRVVNPPGFSLSLSPFLLPSPYHSFSPPLATFFRSRRRAFHPSLVCPFDVPLYTQLRSSRRHSWVVGLVRLGDFVFRYRFDRFLAVGTFNFLVAAY